MFLNLSRITMIATIFTPIFFNMRVLLSAVQVTKKSFETAIIKKVKKWKYP